MKVLQYILWALWRIWFYMLLSLLVILFSPLLILFLASEKTYPLFYKIARLWGLIILYSMGFYVKAKWQQRLQKGKSYMLVANHTSMMDIMMMYALSKNPFVFVGKKELAKFPIFGFFYRKANILVDRNDPKSRVEVFKQAQARLKQGLSICIFPEGGVPDDESIILDEFKDGAFRLAIDHQIPIVPMVFPDNKKRYPYRFTGGSPGKLRAKILPFIDTKGMTQDNKKELKDKTRAVILEELVSTKK